MSIPGSLSTPHRAQTLRYLGPREKVLFKGSQGLHTKPDSETIKPTTFAGNEGFLTRVWNFVCVPFQWVFSWSKPQKADVDSVPSLIPPKPTGLLANIKYRFRMAKRWFNPIFLIARLQAFYKKYNANNVLKRLEKLTPEEMKAIIAAPALEKIDFPKEVRKSTGVAKATHFFGADDPIMKSHRDYTYQKILESYGVSWTPFKVARDALQNFYDGQGQTLDGVKIDIQKAGSNRHRVKINASATYDVDKLLALGGTGKQGENVAAGGFGEGAKVMALILLRDYGAKTVTFRSGEWQADFKLDYPGAENVSNKNTKGLMVKLTPVNPPIKGNNLEFETDNQQLAAMLQRGQELFYNPNNENFKNPMFENEVGGFKLLTGKDSPGRVYEAGQLREFENPGKFDAIPGLMIWSNKKVLNLNDRDRTAIQGHDVRKILNTVIKSMTLEQTTQGIQVLRKHWFYQKPEDMLEDEFNRGQSKVAANMILDLLCQHYEDLKIRNEGLRGTFKLRKEPAEFLPKGLVAVMPHEIMDGPSQDVKELIESGYLPVNPSLERLGIPNGWSLLSNQTEIFERNATKVDSLTEKEQHKKNHLSQALHSLVQALRKMGDSWNADKLEILSELPIEVVTRPEPKQVKTKSGRHRPEEIFMTVSTDEKRILVDRKVLSGKSFPEAISSLFNLAHLKSHVDPKDLIAPWILENLENWQKVKAFWDKKD